MLDEPPLRQDAGRRRFQGSTLVINPPVRGSCWDFHTFTATRARGCPSAKGAQSSLNLPVAEQYRWSPPQGPGLSTNLAQSYTRFARDYREGTHFCPTFDDAVTRHRMLNAIETAAATGQRQTLS